ncbi:unnamed protein product [Protopolystoma xenopodis]|uniref:Uncharacterized protein n=1 Tax=Protopolystoma xenopodis TaxID=117903 RepID=A0A3S5AA44_9PLAT|nr:unnamed protein product [Protopolystoma xenopodis]
MGKDECTNSRGIGKKLKMTVAQAGNEAQQQADQRMQNLELPAEEAEVGSSGSTRTGRKVPSPFRADQVGRSGRNGQNDETSTGTSLRIRRQHLI